MSSSPYRKASASLEPDRPDKGTGSVRSVGSSRLGALYWAVLAALSLVGCTSATGHTRATTTTSSTVQVSTPRTTVRKPPPPTNSLPSAPQPSPEAAATVFMQGWMAGNRAQSASVATASAVATLFATPYQQQPLNDRGCTDAFPPFQCTWGPFAGGSGSIYQITLAPAPGGRWYVSGVDVES